MQTISAKEFAKDLLWLARIESLSEVYYDADKDMWTARTANYTHTYKVS